MGLEQAANAADADQGGTPAAGADQGGTPAAGGQVYLCIDLKSFYASVECVARGLDPFTTNLVVADPSRTEKTICLAITPAMKALGIPNRCRVFEIPPGVDYLMAPPRMQRYMEVSADIYATYLRYVSPEDVHVYSIDECFIDATPYLALYGKTPRELAVMLMDAVFARTGICATAGIGTNLFLAKVALDITAKHVADHIGYLDEQLFRETIWDHRPITDVWNVGPGIAARLAKYGVFDLRGVCGLQESTLYREFGTNAEYLIDHAHGVEPCTIRQIHEYVPKGSSLTNAQVLSRDYDYDEALVILREMVDALVLELVDKDMVAGSISLDINYAKEDAAGGAGWGGAPGDRGAAASSVWRGQHGSAHRWKAYPHVGATRKMPWRTSSRKKIMGEFLRLYEEIARPGKMVRRVGIGLGDVVPEDLETIDLFTDVQAEAEEHALQKTILELQGKFGKNAVLKGVSLTAAATARERNNTIGGHRAR